MCWAIYVMVTFYIDVKDRKLQELQKLQNQTESAGEYIPEYDYYESTDFQLPIRFLQENFQNSRIDIISYILTLIPIRNKRNLTVNFIASKFLQNTNKKT